MPDPTEPEDIHDDSPEGGDAPKSLIDQRKLAEEAGRRRKELPLLQRIVKHFSKDRAVYRELVIIMTTDPTTIESCTHLLWTAHNLERIADRTTNIAERVVFTVTGMLPAMDVSRY